MSGSLEVVLRLRGGLELSFNSLCRVLRIIDLPSKIQLTAFNSLCRVHMDYSTPEAMTASAFQFPMSGSRSKRQPNILIPIELSIPYVGFNWKTLE